MSHDYGNERLSLGLGEEGLGLFEKRLHSNVSGADYDPSIKLLIEDFDSYGRT